MSSEETKHQSAWCHCSSGTCNLVHVRDFVLSRCKFDEKGYCRNSDDCTWEHESDDSETLERKRAAAFNAVKEKEDEKAAKKHRRQERRRHGGGKQPASKDNSTAVSLTNAFAALSVD
jgi:hypothetical protein